MPSRNQAELAVELAQGRFWQPLDQRLAIMTFCAFVSDQQMSSSLKAVFESLAPGNLYRVRLLLRPNSQVGDERYRAAKFQRLIEERNENQEG